MLFRSGLTQKAFARREGIKYPTLVSWVQRRRRKETAGVGPTFAEFTMAGPSGLEVRWPDGVVIRGASLEDVAKVLFAGDYKHSAWEDADDERRAPYLRDASRVLALFGGEP